MTKSKAIAHAFDKQGRRVSASTAVIEAKIKAGELTASAPSKPAEAAKAASKPSGD